MVGSSANTPQPSILDLRRSIFGNGEGEERGGEGLARRATVVDGMNESHSSAT